MDVLQLGLFLITLIEYCVAANANSTQIPVENITAGRELRKELLKNYDKVVIPASNKKPLKTKLTIVFNSVEMNYQTSQMQIYGWMKVEWNDERLMWDPNGYDQIRSALFEYQEIWHPDYMAYNNIEANTVIHGLTQSLVDYNGNVLWVQPIQYRIQCRTDLTHWPHDTQTGILKVGSWVYSINEINLTKWTYEIDDMNSYLEWQIFTISNEKKTTLYSCCPNNPYDTVEFSIAINRNTTRHHPINFLPATSTALLNLVVLWISPEDKFKLIASLFNVLIVVVILLIMYSKIPFILTSIPLIVFYYIYSLGLIISTVIISMMMKNMTKTLKPHSKLVKICCQPIFMKLLGEKFNDQCLDNQHQQDVKEHDSKFEELYKRQIFIQLINKICFIIFSLIYAILLFYYIF